MEDNINYKEKLEALKEQHDIIMDNIYDIVYQLNNMGFVEYANSSVERLGYTPEELIGKHMKEVLPLSEAPKALQALQRLLLGQPIENLEIQVKDKQGNLIYAEINARPIKQDGKIVCVQGIIRDVNEIKKVEKELSRQIEKLEKVNSSMSGREERILELKKEIQKLSEELGR